MKNELFCKAVEDLLPSYAEGLTQAETAAAIEAHLEDCGACRGLFEALQNTDGEKAAEKMEIDYLKTIRKKSRKQVLSSVLITALALVVLLALWAYQSGVFHLVEIVYTEDRTRALAVYDKDISGSGDINSAIYIRQFNDLKDSALTDVKLRLFGGMLTNNTVNQVLRGPYRGSLWSPDGTMYIINLGNGEVTLDSLRTNSSINIHYLIAGALKRETEARFDYEAAEDASLYEGAALTALKWSEDSENVLFYYELTDTEGESHSGYVWYGVLDSTIDGLVENR